MDIRAIVRRKRKTREGKGFSLNELKEANINSKSASKLGISIDLRRKTKHRENVELLGRYLEGLRTPRRSNDRPGKRRRRIASNTC